jgi:hypothetical protein
MDRTRHPLLVEMGGRETSWLVYSPFQQRLSSQVSCITLWELIFL